MAVLPTMRMAAVAADSVAEMVTAEAMGEASGAVGVAEEGMVRLIATGTLVPGAAIDDDVTPAR